MNNEKPLDNLVSNGGFTSIFQTIACIGDSLSSGEMETINKDGTHGYHDLYEYSWGQFMARDARIKVYNFSRGGMSCKEYIDSFASSIDAFNEEKKCKAYIIALGVNDLFSEFAKIELGKIDDYEEKKETMSYYYQEIIHRYKKIEPNAKFFLMTMANENDKEEIDNIRKAHRDFLYGLALKYENVYVIDLYKYGPVYDEDFKEKYYFNGHLSPMGYRYTATLVESYIDYIVRNDYKNFKQVALIGTPMYDPSLDK